MHYKELSFLIGDIYEAAYNPGHWQAVLEKITTLTQSKATALMYQDLKIQSATSTYYHGHDPRAMKEYQEYYGAFDPFFRLSTETVPIGKAVADYHMIPDRKQLEQVCGEFFTGIMQPYDLLYIGGVTLFNDSERIGALTLNRGEKQGPMLQQHLELLTELAPHVQRALRIHSEFVRLKSEENALRIGFDKLVMGLVLFDSMAKPVYINPLAEAILQEHPAINLRNEMINAANDEENRMLRRLIYSAVNQHEDVDARGGSIGLHHPEKATPLPVMITPLYHSDFLGQDNVHHVTAAMYITDPEKSISVSPEVLSDIFSLTPKESAIAVALTNGLSVEEISQINGTTLNTVRSQIKAIFRKTGTNRQTELVRILLSGPFRA